MKINFFNRIGVLKLAVALALGLSLNSQPSHALVGIGAGSIGHAAAGLALIFGGAAIAGKSFDYFIRMENPIETVGGLVGGYAGLFVGWVGLILLDGESGQTLQFRPLESSQAQQLGLDPDKVKIFNSEIEKINLAATAAGIEIAQYPLVDENAGVIKNILDKYFVNVSADARDIVVKVTMHNARLIAAQ